MLVINGVELTFDIFDLETAEAYEKGMDLIKQTSEKSLGDKSLADVIRVQCGVVFDFFDDVFGEGTSFAVFGEKTNLLACLNAFEQVVENADEQRKTAEAMASKYSGTKPRVNRQERRMGARTASQR